MDKTGLKCCAISWMLLALLLGVSSSARAQFTTLYSFTGGTDGAYPYDALLYNSGTLYGTTFTASDGGGTVFKITTAGALKTLYTFGTNPNDGANPWDGVVRDSAGNLYGTTQEGGTDIVGTIFQVTKTGKESVLYDFMWQGGLTGYYPTAGLVLDASGNLYGVTSGGNNSGGGVVFQLTPTDALNVLYSFTDGGDGSGPGAALILDASGNLYGTTGNGGASGSGTVFELSPEPTSGCAAGSNTGNGWCETVLYSFTGGADGGYPQGNLIFDTSGNLYGTTEFGGNASCTNPLGTTGCGTVFELSPEPGSGCPAGSNLGIGWCETPIYAFAGTPDAVSPSVGLVMNSTNSLFGTSEFGGTNGVGTVFELSPVAETAPGCPGANSGNGWCEIVLHSFTGAAYPGDGGYPMGGIALDKSGNLYGTTSAGGYDGICSTCGYGTVFMVSAPAAAAVIMGSSQNPATVGETVTFTATITSKFPIPDGEVVRFTAGANQSGTGYTTNGVATWTTSFSKAKTYTVKGSYPGDVFHKPAHGTVKEIVNAE